MAGCVIAPTAGSDFQETFSYPFRTLDACYTCVQTDISLMGISVLCVDPLRMAVPRVSSEAAPPRTALLFWTPTWVTTAVADLLFLFTGFLPFLLSRHRGFLETPLLIPA